MPVPEESKFGFQGISSRGDPRITIAVLDGAVDLAHPCFEGADLRQLESLTAGGPTRHGTHVASLLFGQGAGVQGIAPSCRGILIPIFEEREDGALLPASQLDLARALRQAIDAGAHLINISGGQLAAPAAAEFFLADAVAACAAQGILIVAAAGNDGCDCRHLPAALSSVLAVGAMDGQGEPLSFSNWGYGGEGLLAPGAAVVGAALGGGVSAQSGTSFATPLVTGAAAILMSEQLASGAKADAVAVRASLLAGAEACQPEERGDCARFLAGRLDLQRSREMLGLSKPAIQEPKMQPGGSVMSESSDLIPAAAAAAAEPAAEAGVAASCADSGGGKPCSCGGGGARTLVYAIGQLGYDLASEARRDSIIQSMAAGNVHDPAALLAHLETNPWEAEAITWTLNLDATTIYAVRPAGPFAQVAYEQLREFLDGQLTEGVERISVPGYRAGSVVLFSGQVVPVIVPELRGLFSWSTTALVDAVAGATPAAGQSAEEHAAHRDEIVNFLGRIYYELRNLGISGQERAINHAATNAFQAAQIFHGAAGNRMALDSIAVERSPICRPGSDCWDVKLTFFNPRERLTTARHVHRFTVDVSDVIPVTVGPVRSWAVY